MPGDVIDHLAGSRVPAVKLRATSRGAVALDRLGPGRTVVYVYPLSGRPGVALPEGWDAIPGARGCTAEACGFRDHHRELAEAGAAAVYGLSAQDTEYQRELVERLHLPFEMLSDERLRLADALGLPTFETGGMRLHRRLTMVIRDGAIEHVFFPVDAPGEHAEEVLTWLRRRTSGTDGEAPRR